ncbi:MAG TPA: hypothetical protein ENH35_03495, partial [Candidatus Moranbacteria bacterium]|nr:hypothetical protein [Candidatus Moranbacteria bacterium]
MKIQYKILIIVLALIIVNKTIVASEPDKKVIEQVAVNFFENLIRLDKSNKSLKVLDIIEHKMNNITCYYTVNFVDDGYVNVSATYAAK